MAQKKPKKFGPYRVISFVLSAGLLALIIGLQVSRSNFPVLQAAGPIAAGEQQMLIKAFLLMLIIVVPVFGLTFWFAFRYREDKKATYKPDWDNNRFAEAVWWTVPTLLIVALSVMTWRGTFQFDPYKPLAAAKDTLKVQVVAIESGWLFIYPDHKIASLNELHVPTNTALQFDITSDTVMNSFWIPQLGGQMYAMPGMGTRLHLQADKTGEFYGSSANLSGENFADMNFKTIAVNKTDFGEWIKKTKTAAPLTEFTYEDIAARDNLVGKVYYYGTVEHGMFGDIIGKYMGVDHHGNPIDGDEHARGDHEEGTH